MRPIVVWTPTERRVLRYNAMRAMNSSTRNLFLTLFVALCPIAVLAAGERGAVKTPAIIQARKPPPDSRQLEKDLQGLTWNQFKTVVDAIPPIKAEVEKYGPAGWQYVKARYKTYAWKKNIDRLSEPERRRLAQLIQEARKKR
jgi:hypothetical protein